MRGHVGLYYIRSYDRQSGLCSVMYYSLCDLVMPSPHSCCACVLVCPQQRDDTRADNTRRRLHLLGYHRRGRTLPPIGEVTKAIPSLRTCPYINLDDLSRQAQDSHQENSHQQMAFPHSDWTIQRCEKRHFCDAIFRSNAVIILPKQARDKHRESTQKKSGCVFLRSGAILLEGTEGVVIDSNEITRCDGNGIFLCARRTCLRCLLLLERRL